MLSIAVAMTAGIVLDGTTNSRNAPKIEPTNVSPIKMGNRLW